MPKPNLAVPNLAGARWVDQNALADAMREAENVGYAAGLRGDPEVTPPPLVVDRGADATVVESMRVLVQATARAAYRNGRDDR